ncbi:hypothetical protein CQW23_32836 [Capsicum baccatum]|uniref:peptidylprolyl isomerase n=1 Tax=Capsicum baccatum TaxID=33114 RepID=A0A2G2V3I7_CAPBA|nr:hypothetical protein CQW23_32836 [Capsicum baccatum]
MGEPEKVNEVGGRGRKREEEESSEYCSDESSDFSIGYDSDDPAFEILEGKPDGKIWKQYYKEWEESEGFDISVHPGTSFMAGIQQVHDYLSDPKIKEEYAELCKLAIADFNSKNEGDNKRYVFEEIVNVNASHAAGTWYYFTFDARDTTVDATAADAIKTFQANVWKGLFDGTAEVYLCRLKKILSNEAAGETIKGFEIGVDGMRVGDKRRITIPPDLGYGDQGHGGVIPPYLWLVLFLDLATYKKTRGSVAKIKIQIDLTQKRPQHVWMGYDEDDNGEGVPDYCNYCKHQGEKNYVEASTDVLKGLYMGPLADELPSLILHSMLLVGFGVRNGVQYYKVKNSGGTEWGHQGFGRIRRDLVFRLAYPIARIDIKAELEKVEVAAPVSKIKNMKPYRSKRSGSTSKTSQHKASGQTQSGVGGKRYNEFVYDNAVICDPYEEGSAEIDSESSDSIKFEDVAEDGDKDGSTDDAFSMYPPSPIPNIEDEDGFSLLESKRKSATSKKSDGIEDKDTHEEALNEKARGTDVDERKGLQRIVCDDTSKTYDYQRGEQIKQKKVMDGEELAGAHPEHVEANDEPIDVDFSFPTVEVNSFKLFSLGLERNCC